MDDRGARISCSVLAPGTRVRSSAGVEGPGGVGSRLRRLLGR